MDHTAAPSRTAPNDQDLVAALTALLKDHSRLNIHLQEVPFDWPTGFHRLAGKFYYISFADGEPTVQDLVEYLYDCLVPYCLPKKKVLRVLQLAEQTKDFSRIIRLGDEAKSLFIQSKNQLDMGGEPGELILYALLEWALSAPRIVSKMYLKTNANMPVHGTDGIHLQHDDETGLLTVYFGESKIYGNFAQAAASAFESMSQLISNTGQISREIEILNTYSDIDALDQPFREKIAEYIDPYSSTASSLKKRIVHACLLGFEYPAYKRILQMPPQDVSSAFERQYAKRVSGICRIIERHYCKSLPVTANLHVFLLPFPSLEDFRRRFYQKLGIEK